MTSWQSRPSPDFHAPSMKSLSEVSYPMRGQISSSSLRSNCSAGRGCFNLDQQIGRGERGDDQRSHCRSDREQFAPDLPQRSEIVCSSDIEDELDDVLDGHARTG